MPDQNQVIDTLYQVIDVLNRQLPPDQKLEKSPDTTLIGEHGRLDSLGFVSFIVAVEQKIEETFQTTIVLTDDSLIADENGPFRTLGLLAGFISAKIKDQTGATG